jgi:hypothetical protein
MNVRLNQENAGKKQVNLVSLVIAPVQEKHMNSSYQSLVSYTENLYDFSMT